MIALVLLVPLTEVPCRNLGNGHSRQSATITMAPAVYKSHPSYLNLITSWRRITVIWKLEEISFLTNIYCQSFCVRYWYANTGMWTSRRQRGQPLEEGIWEHWLWVSEKISQIAITECIGGMVHYCDAWLNEWFPYLEVSWLMMWMYRVIITMQMAPLIPISYL